MSNKHLFILPPGIYRGANVEEIAATADGLKEMDLFLLPYERDVYVQISAYDCVTVGRQPLDYRGHEHCQLIVGPFGADQIIQYVGLNTIENRTIDLSADIRGVDPKTNELRDISSFGDFVKMFLIVMLATRNVVKKTKQHKLAKLGIGKKHWRSQFDYTTTISVPEEMDDDADHVPGAAKAPHLRRGHIRHQHYGPDRAYVKKIWIAPIFVNADPDFVNRRGAYNVHAIA